MRPSIGHIVRKLTKAMVWPFTASYRNRPRPESLTLAESRASFLEDSEANLAIAELVLSDRPFMVGRFGAVELNAIIEIDHRLRLKPYQRFYEDALLRNRKWASVGSFAGLNNNAGFFPISEKMLFQFRELMVRSMLQVDILGSWVPGENHFADYLKNARVCNLRALEPYYHQSPWSSNLRDMKVLVIHPFAETIASQYRNHRVHLFPLSEVLPEFSLLVQPAVQSIAGTKTRFGNWFEALDSMLAEVAARNFDIAIIGCGAYGFPLAAEIKKLGKRAIHLGGATQILFGIKGRRWESMPEISRFFNDHWSRPSAEETPLRARDVENSCYW